MAWSQPEWNKKPLMMDVLRHGIKIPSFRLSARDFPFGYFWVLLGTSPLGRRGARAAAGGAAGHARTPEPSARGRCAVITIGGYQKSRSPLLRPLGALFRFVSCRPAFKHKVPGEVYRNDILISSPSWLKASAWTCRWSTGNLPI